MNRIFAGFLLLMCSVAAHAGVATWTLNGVTFADGGTVSGSFDYDADTNTISDWSLDIAGGDTGTFPVITLDTGNSTVFIGNTGDPQDRITFSLNGDTRQLRMTPVDALTNMGGTTDLDLATGGGGSGGVECFNCSTFRLINGGSLESYADISIAKSDDPDPVLAGTQLTYTVRVDNLGDAPATDVEVTDTLPAGVSLASTSGCAEDPAGVPTCTLGTIEAGAFAEFSVTVDVAASTLGVIDNTVAGTTSSAELVTDNNSVVEQTTVIAEADLSITKIGSEMSVNSGDTVVYTIEVSNAGPSDATNVVVDDQLPASAILNFTNGCLNDPDAVPLCLLGTVPAGGMASYQISITLLSSEPPITNSATVSSDTPDPDGGNNSASETTEVEAVPVPTLDVVGLALLMLLLSTVGWAALRRS